MNVKMIRGVCSACLAAFLAFPTSSLPSILADTTVVSGNCGVNGSEVTWKVDSKVLTIGGEGEMKNYSSSDETPWHEKANDIDFIVIGKKVKSIGNNAFSELSNVTYSSITIDGSETNESKLEKIGVNAFHSNSCQTEDGLKYVGNWLVGIESIGGDEIIVRDGTVGTADFASGGNTLSLKTIVMPVGLKYIGTDFFSLFDSEKLEKVYIGGTKNRFESNSEVKKIPENVEVYYRVINDNDFSVSGYDENNYHVGSRPDFKAEVDDSRLTIEEKWVGGEGTEIVTEITKDNGKTFEEGISYEYVVVLKAKDKFEFDVNGAFLIDGKSFSHSTDYPIKEIKATLRNGIEAVPSTRIDEVVVGEKLNALCEMVGEKPQFVESIGSDICYSVVSQVWEKIDSSGASEIAHKNSDDSEAVIQKDFEEYSMYKYIVRLKPIEGFYFSPALCAKLCGKDAEKINFEADGSVTITSQELATVPSFLQIPEKKPTCTEQGNREYFKCGECGACFESIGGEEIDEASVKIPMLSHDFETISDENGHYRKCKECGTQSETVAHTFDKAWSSDSENHYHKCTGCDYKKDVANHTFDKKVEDKKYLKEGLTCGDVLSYYKSCECGESSKGTESEETFESEEGKKLEHEFGKDGVCTICSKTNYKVDAVNGSTYTETEDGSLVFRANGSIDKLSSVKVDGTVLTEEKDYTVKSGSTIVELKNDYLKTLSEGEHNLTVVYEDGECETKFNVKADDSTNDDDPENDDNNGSKGDIISDIIYKTGDNAGLISLVSTVLTSGLASVWFAKKRKRNK